MILLNPRQLTKPYPDPRSAEVMRKTVAFFEAKVDVARTTLAGERAQAVAALNELRALPDGEPFTLASREAAEAGRRYARAAFSQARAEKYQKDLESCQKQGAKGGPEAVAGLKQLLVLIEQDLALCGRRDDLARALEAN